MILVDSSLWTDYFIGVPTPQAGMLEGLPGNEPLAIGDLILVEVPRGLVSDRDFDPLLVHLGPRPALPGIRGIGQDP